MRKIGWALVVWALYALGSSHCLARDTTLPPVVAASLKQYRLPAGSLSIFAQDLTNDEVILSLNAEQVRQPASTIKALTTFVALDSLSSTFTWKTRAFVDGTLQDGVLDGNLIIVGGGDPYMTADRWWRFVTSVRQLGLRSIHGDVIIDRGYFLSVGEDRSSFDGAPEKTYNVLPDPLMVNFQTAQFTVLVGTDKTTSIMVDPQPANLAVANQIRVDPGRCVRGLQGLRVESPDGPNGSRLEFSGSIADGCGPLSLARAIMTPAEFAYGTFRTYFEQQGGQISGTLRSGALSPSARLFLTQESLTLGEVIRLINKFSNNVMARTLLLTLAAERVGIPGTLAAGQKWIFDWLDLHHIDHQGWVIDNGAGLSRTEALSAFGLAQVLKIAWQSQWMPEFSASLPLAATDGTLRNRFSSSAMRGRIRMKTGHLDGVTSLAGYVHAANGRPYVVVTLINDPNAAYGGDEVQATVLKWVFSR